MVQIQTGHGTVDSATVCLAYSDAGLIDTATSPSFVCLTPFIRFMSYDERPPRQSRPPAVGNSGGDQSVAESF